MKQKIFNIDSFVKEFILSLKKPKNRIEPQIIIAPYGPSCVGKSTVMKAIAKKLPLAYISSDGLRILLRNKGFDESLLKKHHLFEGIAEKLLKEKYSLILDANFASSSGHLEKTEKLVQKFKAKLFLIRIAAPKIFVLRKIKNKKWLLPEKGGLLATKKEAIEHFLRSSKQYDYKQLMPRTFLSVDSSEQIGKEIRSFIRTVKKEFIFY